MHILFLSDNFPPEGNAPATRTFEHAREWVKKGHSVTVITCCPNFPSGKVFKGYSNAWLTKERVEGIRVWRVKTYIAANQGVVKRSLDFISFMMSAFVFGIFTKNVDVVVGTSPQFFTVIAAWALARLKRVPFVFELRDIWPEAVGALQAVSNSRVLGFLERVELFLYKQSNLIISVTHSFKTQLQLRGVLGDKIKVVLNGVDLSKYQPVLIKEKALATEFNLDSKFVAGYIGTNGMAHSLDTVVDAAEILSSDERIRFLFAGDGADRARLEERVDYRKLENVVMIGQQNKNKMPRIWSLCDVSIVKLKNLPIYSSVIPSKIFESMAMGIPIIIGVPTGEATNIVARDGSGLVVSPESPSELANAIRMLADDSELYDGIVRASRLAVHKYDRKVAALKMLEYLCEVAD